MPKQYRTKDDWNKLGRKIKKWEVAVASIQQDGKSTPLFHCGQVFKKSPKEKDIVILDEL